MIHHIIRFTVKPGVSNEQLDELLSSLGRQATEVPTVASVHVGRVHGERHTWGANFVLRDLDAYWEFITHPAHLETDKIGWPLLDDFTMFDIVEDTDPTIGEAISALHERRLREIPELSDVVAPPRNARQKQA
ncbi:Dabb family protein [Brevibacterium atlanticum]|uniref:Dabb family protein n=1 Tax=Brevibacterium atlanticum TaxID=2697563 RepID=UPI00141FA703|nr:Dabb family protein [Brevibacterium atlanticum]